MKRKKGHKIYRVKGDVKITDELINSINGLLAVLSSNCETIREERIRELIRSPLFEIYFLEVDGKIAGMASLHYMETLIKKSAWVEDVVIHPEHQGKGLGKKIMRYAIREAKKRGIKHLDLTSSPKRVVANKLYQKLKFEPRETSVYRLKLKG